MPSSSAAASGRVAMPPNTPSDWPRVRSTRSPGLRRANRFAFTLIELIIVMVVIGLIAAVAVPRLTKGLDHSAGKTAMGMIRNVRVAMDLFYVDHERYPGYVVGSGAPDGTAFVNQLTLYTNKVGTTNTTFGKPYLFGPYLTRPFPKNPFNDLATVGVKRRPSDPDPAARAVGWVAILSTGDFGINPNDSDLVPPVDAGKLDIVDRLLPGITK